MKKLLLSVVFSLCLGFALPQTAYASTTSTGNMEIEVSYIRGTGLTLTRILVDGQCVSWSLVDGDGNLIASGDNNGDPW